MKLSNFAAAAAFVLLSSSVARGQGQDQFVFGVSGGITIPSGVAADLHKAGPNGTLMLGIGAVDSPFGVRFDRMYSALGRKTNPKITTPLGSARLTSLSANIIYDIVGNASRVYFVGGAGAFTYNPNGTGTKAKNDFGVNAGLGLWLPFVDAFVEARWFNFYRALPDETTNATGKRSLRIYPINVGFMF